MEKHLLDNYAPCFYKSDTDRSTSCRNPEAYTLNIIECTKQVFIQYPREVHSAASCFFKYFLVRYLRYLLENGILDSTTMESFSVETVTEVPRFPVLWSTLILWVRYDSKSLRTI